MIREAAPGEAEFIIPAEDVDELRAHYQWGVEGEQTVEHLAEALRRVGAVLEAWETW